MRDSFIRKLLVSGGRIYCLQCLTIYSCSCQLRQVRFVLKELHRLNGIFEHRMKRARGLHQHTHDEMKPAEGAQTLEGYPGILVYGRLLY